ncbi:MAG: CBS domain-containing protein [Cyclobacteriaceae bacterium]
MGDQNISRSIDQEIRLNFTRNLLDDLEALEKMLLNNQIESGITRIGAEQEFCLVNKHWRPAENAMAILEGIDDPHFTTELAKYNLEINLDPRELTGDAFSQVELQLRDLLNKAKIAADAEGSKIILSGILPTISTYQLGMNYMTPMPRYYALNDMMKKLRGGDFYFHLSGIEELTIKHGTVMFEAFNTSFQMHLQIDPEDFTASYNWSQAIAGPVLGMCVNSPLLLGRELWSETRIALFQQSIDTRGVSKALKEQPARVAFGDDWADGTIVDLFKKEIARHKIILSRKIGENALEVLANGGTPKLEAANLFNGTIYHWNRACYGVGNGKAHLRIENRYVPAGPTVIDEMANFAFWVGLMVGRPAKFDDINSKMDFKDIKSNFIKSARNGSESVMIWEGKEIGLKELVLKEFVPIAKAGLEKMKIDPHDIDRLLGVIEKRAKSHNGAQWTTKAYRNLKSNLKRDDALIALTKSIHDYQQKGIPVHKWNNPSELPQSNEAATDVGHLMSTQVVTATMNDTAELTLRIMEWKGFHHLPVVDAEDRLVGLLTWNHLKHLKDFRDAEKSITVADIMETQLITVKTSTSLKQAQKLITEHQIGCLPVIQNRQLVGIVTSQDLEDLKNA